MHKIQNRKYLLPKKSSIFKKLLLVLAFIVALPIIISFFAILTSCSEKTHDVEYYLEHPKERTEKIAECKNNPGDNEKKPNCINAMSAEYKSMFKGDKLPQIK